MGLGEDAAAPSFFYLGTWRTYLLGLAADGAGCGSLGSVWLLSRASGLPGCTGFQKRELGQGSLPLCRPGGHRGLVFGQVQDSLVLDWPAAQVCRGWH
jgi:hypothetical protein